MSVPLVIGAPIYARGWIIDGWLDSIAALSPPAGTRYLFALTPSPDKTEAAIRERLPDAEILIMAGLPAFGDDERDDPRRFAVLAHIRNALLRRVCSIAPEHYLSLDSDILLEPGALQAMLELDKDAVGALVDMGGDVHPGHWSWMTLDGDDAYRPAVATPAEPFQVGVIMGAKLLAPAAYCKLRYADHLLGEDIGFALHARVMGVELWVHPAARGRHEYRLPQAASR